MRIRPKDNDDNDINNIFWVTMTDLMTGLVLVFIVLFFYTYMSSHIDKIKQDLAKENSTKILQETLKEKDIKATEARSQKDKHCKDFKSSYQHQGSCQPLSYYGEHRP